MIELINQAAIINHTQQFLHILRPLVNHQSVHDYFDIPLILVTSLIDFIQHQLSKTIFRCTFYSPHIIT